jgi:hypothetical protein
MSARWIWFVVTVLVLVASLLGTLVTGKRGRRIPHFTMASVTITVLVAAIVQAETIGNHYVFGEPLFSIHMGFAYAASASVLPVLGSGLFLARWHRGRKLHVVAVGLFLVMVVGATATGVLMFTDATPR